MASPFTNTKSNQNMIYAYLASESCRAQQTAYQNCMRTGTAGKRDPSDCYQYTKPLLKCMEKQTKLDPISIPIFNDVRECLFQNDSHLFNCKQQLNELLESHLNPENYKQMLLVSTPYQRQPKKYNTTLNWAKGDFN